MMGFITDNAWILAAMLGLVAIELVWRRWIARRGYDLGAMAASFGLAVGNALIKPLTAIVIGGVYVFLHELAPISFPVDDWRTWVAGFVAVEFVYYWFHRWSHEVRWLWATHVVHHSAEEFTLPAAIRLGWTNLLSGGWLLFGALALIGFPPVVIVTLLGINLLYQFLLHTEIFGRLGWLEWVLNTPAHHRVHHASNEDFLDKNYGGVVIVFDRLFGTFAQTSDEGTLRYGLVHGSPSRNPFVIALWEWFRMFQAFRTAQGWRNRLAALVGPPQ